jgi:hypothetical protein
MIPASQPTTLVPPACGAWQLAKADSLRRITMAVLVFGLAWRVLRYLLQFPIWGDEAMLALNFLHLDYAGLTQRLEHGQIAPILFLWGELTACQWLGPTELSLRLVPLVAGSVGLVLYWRLTRLLAGPLASGLALAFLALATAPVGMCALIKPYSGDLLWSMALLLPAAQWLKNPGATWRLALLVCLTPVALLGSYPAVFVAGGISVALAWPVYGRASRAAWLLYVAFNLAILGGFGASYWIGTQHLGTQVGHSNTAAGMEDYWSDGFPPAPVGRCIVWFVLTSTGQMAAYPIGASNGGSTLTVLLCLVGAWQYAKARQWKWLVLFAAPFGLWLLAAALHRYPYGAAFRLSQHVAPIICLLAGLGTAALIDRPGWSEVRRWRWACVAFGLLGLVGVGGLVRDVAQPYHDRGAPWARDVMADVRARVPASDPIVLCSSGESLGCLLWWYWALEGDRVHWNGQLAESRNLDARQHLWAFSYGEAAARDAECLQARLQQRDPGWRLAERIPYAFVPRSRNEDAERCELFHFVRDQAAP